MDVLNLVQFEWLDRILFNNSIRDYIGAIIVVCGMSAVMKLYALLIGKKMKAMAEYTANPYDDFFVATLDRVATPLLVALAAYFLTQLLNTPKILERGMSYVLVIAFTFYAATSALRFLDFICKNLTTSNSGFDRQAIQNIRLIAKVTIWIVGTLLVLKNLGYDVTSLLAGLGIAGVGIALALQNILSDLFSYVSILVDKPFTVGDYITIGDDAGVVDNIGLRSTRIKTLHGQELIISNADLTSARINNFKQMRKRRVVTGLGFVYGTPSKKLEAVPGWIKEIVESLGSVTFDRCHFKAYGASSLDFETVYYVESGDYAEFMDLQQSFNLKIYKKFEEESVDFAFPTQTIILENPENNAP